MRRIGQYERVLGEKIKALSSRKTVYCDGCRRKVYVVDCVRGKYQVGEVGPVDGLVCKECAAAIVVSGPFKRSTIAGEVVVGLAFE